MPRSTMSACARRAASASALASALACAAPAAAQEAAQSLTLDQAVERTLAYNEEIAVLAAEAEAASQWRLAARDLKDPELRLQYSDESTDSTSLETGTELVSTTPGAMRQTTQSASSEGTVYGAGLRFFPPHPWLRRASVSLREAEYNAALADLAHARWLKTMEVKLVFAELQYLEDDLRLVDEIASRQAVLLEQMDQMANQGQAVLDDVVNASRRFLGVQGDRDRAARRRQEVLGRLAVLVNLPADRVSIQVAAPLPHPPAQAPGLQAEMLEQMALQTRADLIALAWRTQAAKAAQSEAEAESIPWLTFVQASIIQGDESQRDQSRQQEIGQSSGLSRIDLDTRDRDSDQTEWRVDAGVTLPLLSWRNRKPHALRADYHAATIREAEATKRAGREIRDAVAGIEAVRQEWTRYETRSAPVLEKLQKMAERARAGEGLTLEQASRLQEQILETQRLRLRSEYDYRTASLALEAALGAPPPEPAPTAGSAATP